MGMIRPLSSTSRPPFLNLHPAETEAAGQRQRSNERLLLSPPSKAWVHTDGEIKASSFILNGTHKERRVKRRIVGQK